MIENTVYIPYLQRNIIVIAKDDKELEAHAKLAGEIRDIPGCEKWHEWEGVVQAYLETLDSLRRCGNAV